jgi:hypothetical protein
VPKVFRDYLASSKSPIPALLLKGRDGDVVSASDNATPDLFVLPCGGRTNSEHACGWRDENERIRKRCDSTSGLLLRIDFSPLKLQGAQIDQVARHTGDLRL